ncbi:MULTISPECIES: glycosyltransferase family 2 protein [Lactiplantibacillus]|uniref:Glycosyltransferase n=1 Tax=Lactiplantibacillus pentosus TaxID=1589 RepID=A0A3M6KU05_LACPE|nr:MULTISPECIES: glycosyltransferase family 2 protein [Lactiplantibacillus]MBU7461070.1 glycosyltransferase family 2 protein [Lactiplantibacillus pentosus]MBU7476438.1 glycosyltransferase family 2 protein [Lactiplantibacillus pentosus]MBU7483649.1 glycosyltransferase family 2 protein [Lactiplantibacillus sp. 30.2.29]MBU7487266.1 glycosyltransferase family 2 protein [Lactiplantibacillus pentosus]MBU7500036.1 glycosyltransferase family 2 protein [Lactiplantibacillus pentosus]
MRSPRLTIIVPCYNEEAVLPKSAHVLAEILMGLIQHKQVNSESKLLFVDDGSQDATWALVKELETQLPVVTGIKFSRNFGHQNALMAGMKTACPTSDMMITIDADLQDDPQVIPEMVARFHAGSDVVLGVRNDRSSDSHFKRWTAERFYGLMNRIGVQLVPDHADFRLLSQRAVRALLSYQETNLFLRGIVPQLGFPTTKLYYRRRPRFAGVSKYPLRKMLSFAFDGITSFSIAPIKVILMLGVLISGGSLLMMVYAVIQGLLGTAISGWSSLMTSLWFLGGMQLIGISVVGEYVGKIFAEVKHRPRYIIETDDYTVTQQPALLDSQRVHV